MNNPLCDILFVNARAATMASVTPAYGMMENAGIAVKGDKIVWIGSMADIPAGFEGATKINLEDRLITPGLVDCHTHLVYAGNRAYEFEMALGGATYEEISKAGGGIVSTVKATRSASVQQLTTESLPRLEAMLAEGVTTVEIKSGYGLDSQSEIKMLEVAQKFGNRPDINVRKTYLAAHALPVEFTDRKDDYIDAVCNDFLPAAHAKGLIDAVDGFCEGIGFSTDQIQRVFETAKNYDLPVKLHAEQLSDLGGAALAAKYNALSADHLEYVSASSVEALANAGTVAVLLPGAFYFLKEKKLPPLALFRESGVPIALGTDSNPGSSPTTSPLLMMNMACTLFGMTPEEALQGFTINGAKALGIEDQVGTLEAGKISYRIGFNPLQARYKAGKSYTAAGMAA
jgi:imidazolonepropionase